MWKRHLTELLPENYAEYSNFMHGKICCVPSTKLLDCIYPPYYRKHILVNNFVIQSDLLSCELDTFAPYLGKLEVPYHVSVDFAANIVDCATSWHDEGFHIVGLFALWLHIDPDKIQLVIDFLL